MVRAVASAAARHIMLGGAALASLLALVLACPFTLNAQVVEVALAEPAVVLVAPGARLVVPVRAELRDAAPLTLAALEGSVTWSASRLLLDSIVAVPASGFTLTSNAAAASTGMLRFNSYGTSALATSGAVAELYFTASPSTGGTRVALSLGAAGSEEGRDLLPYVRIGQLDVCIASSARWGDANGDSTVNILDAQQIARFSVGLGVANLAAVTERGDVTADGVVNIIDAQQVARFSVGLTAASRVNTVLAVVPAPASLDMTTPSIEVTTGRWLTLDAEWRDASGASLAGCYPIAWSSSVPAVASVTSSGQLLGVAPGTATITASGSGFSSSVSVTIRTQPVAALVVSPSVRTLYVGQTATLVATPIDSSGAAITGRPVAWGSSDPAVVSVDVTGAITALAPGVATVTATLDGSSGTSTVTVTPVPVASVAVTPASTVLFPGQTAPLAATARDSAGGTLPGRAVTWSSSNSAVAVVSASGIVSALAPGSASVTATIEGQSATATLTVSPVPVASVTVTPAEAAIAVGTTTQLTATPRDSSGGALAGRTVTWSSGNTAVATVGATGIVTGVSVGTVTISASSEVRTATASVTVTPVPVASVTVSPSAPSLAVGQTVQLTATTVAADGSTLTGRTVTWSSSNSAVASVSGTGLVTAVGIGTATIVATSEGRSGSAAVGVLLPVSNFVLVAGNEHNCVLVTGGNAYCWGGNSSGQLGLGTSSPSPELRPRAVSSSSRGRIESFATLAIGGKTQTTCGLLSGGTGFCWGSNLWGNIGDGTLVARSFPMEMSGTRTFARISTGWTHSCALTRTGEGFCWGLNTNGQLGDGTATQRLTPTAVTGGRTFTRISAGYNGSCGVTSGGDLYCWGDDPVGDGTAQPSTVPVQVGAGRSYAAVFAGFRNACALTPTGQAWCWGLARSNGQLGNGGTEDQLSPVAVSGGLSFTALAKGEDHTCGLTADGAIYCWGSNGYGQLGDGTVVGRTVPTRVSGGATYTALAAGAFHSCGATTTGVVNCWGRNNSGQLGDGTTTGRLVPTPWNP